MPVPAGEIGNDKGKRHYKKGNCSHREADAGHCHYGGVGKGLSEGVQIQFVSRTEDEYGQEDIEHRVGINVSRSVYGLLKKACICKQVESVERSNEQSEAEEPYGIWKCGSSQNQFEQGSHQ